MYKTELPKNDFTNKFEFLKNDVSPIKNEFTKFRTENDSRTPTPPPAKMDILESVLPSSLIESDLENYTLGKVLGLGSYAVVKIYKLNIHF